MPSLTSSHAHHGTPTLQVSDARGLPVRTVQLYRRKAEDPIETRVTEQRFNPIGRLLGSRDPYLFKLAQTGGTTPFNLTQVTSLSGVPLLTDSVDAGWRVALLGEAGQGLETWDGRGSQSQTEYDELLRPVAVREQGHDVPEHTLERFSYADASAEVAAHNLCGQMIHHHDPAGTVQVHDMDLSGNVLSHTRRFLRRTDAPDWPLDVDDREALLEPGDGATTLNVYAASGEALGQTDAMRNVQTFAYTLDGQLKNTRLTLAADDQTEKLLVSDLHYNATGQIESETAGNGVITRHRYDGTDGRLTELSAHRANGTPLQHLKYQYDAGGNVLGIEDTAQPIRYYNNQRIEPIKTYCYDTLHQLIKATGCEAKTGSNGPALPDLQPLPPDPGQIANYIQTFHYDAGGNLLDLVHVGAQAQGRTLTRARYSNRCLPERDGRPPTEEELAQGFDPNGNLRELQTGQPLSWDLRNQLREVRPVVREDEEDKEDDRECYVYDGGGQRVRKVQSSQTKARTIVREVRYLPGVNIRSHGGTGEVLHVITAIAGSHSVQILHFESIPPGEIAQDQMRYSLNDHVQSSTMELDKNADLISQEWFYAFGGTAYWAGRNKIEAEYKTVRYSGKERDATGLLYYGFRYYASWLARWINPDPAGDVDGMNLFSMVRNNPINYGDPDGRAGTELTPKQTTDMLDMLRKNREVLSESELIKTATDYLTKKNVEPNKYIDLIRSTLGYISTPDHYDRPLTANEKEGLHLFWSTNAGAKYVKSLSRKHYENNPGDLIKTTLTEARKGAFSELKKNQGDFGIKLPELRKTRAYDPALQLLESHKGDPKKTISLISASLGKPMRTELFRGTKLQYRDELKIGDVLQTSSFAAFTPNKKTAKDFTDKFHVSITTEETLPVIFTIAGGAFAIDHTTEIEGLFKPMTQLSIIDIDSRRDTHYITLKERTFKPDLNAKWI